MPLIPSIFGAPNVTDDQKQLGQLPWRRLRALRHQPPGRAAKGVRRAVFSAALEQSEQLFVAAASVDYATRPLLAFYGLSQAGRAIAAAATGAAGDKNGWKLSGHGIKAVNLDQGAPLPEIALRDDGRGSFVKIAELLASGTLSNGAELRFLWACIPELQDYPLTGQEQVPNVLTVTVQSAGGDGVMSRLGRVPERFLDEGTNEDEVTEFLESYPTLSGFRNIDSRDDLVRAQPWRTEPGSSPHATILRIWDLPEGGDVREFWTSRTREYGTSKERWVFPAPRGQSLPIHPLVAWWGILYTLSMMARYHPASWVEHLNVDSASTAVPLELALDAALDVCPLLIYQAIQEVSVQ